MKKRIGTVLVAAAIGAASLLPQAPALAVQNNDEVRQGEFALLLVNVLGLYRFLPAAPSEQEAISILVANRIAPANGWEPDKAVVLADLAEVIVKAIDRADEVENPDDPNSWIAYLASIGVPIDTIGLALNNVDPLAEPIAPNVFLSVITTDPLKKRAIFGLPDETEMGTDVAFLVSQRPVTLPEVVDVVVAIPDVPRRPPRPTPI